MKENTRRTLIIISYWGVMALMIWFTSEKYMPFIERLISSVLFAAISIVISICFSKTLFRKTLRNRKTMPLIVKFIIMTLLLATGYALMGEVLGFLESKGFIDSTFFIRDRKILIVEIRNALPGAMAANLIFCVILLYYEYSLLQQVSLESQLKILHAQINPHFMFNVLNYLHVLMQKDTALA